MSITNYSPQRYKLLEDVAEGVGIAVNSGDFKTAVIDIQATGTPDGTLVVYQSNENLPPNVLFASSPNNLYSKIGYTDNSDKSFYDAENPVTVPAGSSSYNVETVGSQWLIVAVEDGTTGTIEILTITLIDNQ